MIMTIVNHSVLYKKKKNVTGYIQYYKKMVGQTQRPWVRQNRSSCLTQCQTEKKSLRLQIFINKHRYISSNTNNISHYFPLIRDEIVDGEGLNYPGYIFCFFFNFFQEYCDDALQNYKCFSYTGAPLSNTLWRRGAKKVPESLPQYNQKQ